MRRPRRIDQRLKAAEEAAAASPRHCRGCIPTIEIDLGPGQEPGDVWPVCEVCQQWRGNIVFVGESKRREEIEATGEKPSPYLGERISPPKNPPPRPAK